MRTLVWGWFIALGAVLAGCGGMPKSLNPFKEEEKRLPGERISILKSQKGIEVDKDVERAPVSLPGAQRNDSWSQPGGVPSNAPGHLEISGSLGSAWSADIGEGSSDEGRLTVVPVVYQNKVFTLDTEGTLSAFSASGGSKLWQVSLAPENEDGSEGYGGGIAAGDGRLFVTTGFGTVYAVNPANGQVAWTRRIGVPVRSSPTVSDGKMYFISTESRLYCLSTADGNKHWTVRGLPETASLLGNASPAVAGANVVVPYPSGEVVAYKTGDGKPAWVDSLSRDSRSGSSLASMSDPARPVVDRGIVFAVGHSGRMVATAQDTGQRLWTKTIHGTQMPWPAGDMVYVVDVNGVLLGLTRKEGKVRWMTELPGSKNWSGPVLASGKLWLASGNGQLVGVDAKTGKIATKRDLGESVRIAPVVASGRMYILADEGQLIALN